MIFLYVSIAMILFAMGLGLVAADFRRVLRLPRPVLVGTACQLILLPLVGLSVAALFGLGSELALGVVLIAACPGGSHSNLFTNLAHGDTALSITLTAVSGVLAIVTLPLWMHLASSSFGGGPGVVMPPALSMTAQLLGLVALPLALGMLARSRAPGAARRAEPWVKGFAVSLLLLIVVGSVARNGSRVASFALDAGLPVLCLNVGTMALGFAVSRLLRLPGAQTIAVTLEVGVQNGALCYFVAATLLKNDLIAVPGIVYSLMVYATAGLVVLIGRRMLPRPPGASDGSQAASPS